MHRWVDFEFLFNEHIVKDIYPNSHINPFDVGCL